MEPKLAHACSRRRRRSTEAPRMITRYNSPFRSRPHLSGVAPARRSLAAGRTAPPLSSWRASCSQSAGKAEPSQPCASSTLSLPHTAHNELATLEFGLQQLARLEDELAPDGAVPGPLMLALSPSPLSAPSSGLMPLPRRRCRCGAATPHCDSDRDHDRLSPARRPMATALSRRVAGARVQRPGRLMSTLRTRTVGVSGLTSSWCRCATTGRSRASCRASA